ncbi:response regulator transcription factor [Verrucomicrobiaceae bacterium 227]
MTILLAEDEPDTREMMTEILQEEGYQVFAVPDGIAAIEHCQKHAIDLLLLDIMMPGKSGYDLCREIRKGDPGVPVMFVSAKSEEIDVVLGLELGADDFLRKPFGRHELLARVRALLRRRFQSHRATSLSFGPWTIWPTQLRASQGDNEIDLTPREIRLIEFFLKRSGEALSRDELLDECWGLDYFPESRTLDQHISNLRKKLGSNLIETVRNVGYRAQT